MPVNIDSEEYRNQNSRWATPSQNYVPEYQTSGLPSVIKDTAPALSTGTPLKIEFNSITRWIILHNIVDNSGNHPIRFGFSEQGVLGANYFEIHAGEQTPRLELRCKEIYVISAKQNDASDFSVLAGLTNIPSSKLLTYSGTGIG